MKLTIKQLKGLIKEQIEEAGAKKLPPGVLPYEAFVDLIEVYGADPTGPDKFMNVLRAINALYVATIDKPKKYRKSPAPRKQLP